MDVSGSKGVVLEPFYHFQLFPAFIILQIRKLWDFDYSAIKIFGKWILKTLSIW